MFGIGPIWSLLIGPRVWANAKSRKLRNSILLTNLAVAVMVGGLMARSGHRGAADLRALVVIAGTAGVPLFFVQHQFEDVYWENSDVWSYSAASCAAAPT